MREDRALVDAIWLRCEKRKVRFLIETIVQSVQWRPGHITARALQSGRPAAFEASAGIITLPLGVLQSGMIQFDPPLVDKRDLLSQLRVSSVVKVSLQFRSRFWPVGASDAPKELARPIEQTLFFAGEAANTEHQLGTVHGAISTGLRVAKEVLTAEKVIRCSGLAAGDLRLHRTRKP